MANSAYLSGQFFSDFFRYATEYMYSSNNVLTTGQNNTSNNVYASNNMLSMHFILKVVLPVPETGRAPGHPLPSWYAIHVCHPFHIKSSVSF